MKNTIVSPRNAFFIHKVRKGLVTPNVMCEQKSLWAQVFPGGSEFPHHVVVSVKTIMNEAINSRYRMKQWFQNFLGIANIQIPSTTEGLWDCPPTTFANVVFFDASYTSNKVPDDPFMDATKP